MKFNPASPLRRLTDSFPREGRLDWIGVRPERHGEVVAVSEVEARAERGLTGDHRARKAGSRRQVTLIQGEHLEVVAALLRQTSAKPELARRNLVVSGVSVLALKDQTFRIGDAVFEGTGPCEPCSRMEVNFGPGGYNAMRGHGGITARVIRGGVLRIGDSVTALPEALARASDAAAPGAVHQKENPA